MAGVLAAAAAAGGETQFLGSITLYHLTNEDSARKIAASKQMLRGGGGTYGAGDYFGESQAACMRMAQHGKTHMVTATVRMGTARVIRQRGAMQYTYRQLIKEGCQSVYAPGGPNGNNAEYVVYNFGQVDLQRVEALDGSWVWTPASAADSRPPKMTCPCAGCEKVRLHNDRAGDHHKYCCGDRPCAGGGQAAGPAAPAAAAAAPICSCGPACGRPRDPNPKGGYRSHCGNRCRYGQCGHGAAAGGAPVAAAAAAAPICSCGAACGRSRAPNPSGGYFSHCGNYCRYGRCNH